MSRFWNHLKAVTFQLSLVSVMSEGEYPGVLHNLNGAYSNAVVLTLGTNYAEPAGTSVKSYGFSVRCIKD